MPISSRFVINSTIFLLLVGFIALLAIVGTTIWLGENAQRYVDEAVQVRETAGYRRSNCAAHCRAPSPASAAFWSAETKSIWRLTPMPRCRPKPSSNA